MLHVGANAMSNVQVGQPVPGVSRFANLRFRKLRFRRFERGSVSSATTETAVPRLRGVLHAASAPLTLIAGALLIGMAQGTAVRIASAVFVLTALNLFSVSATYHIGRWSVNVKRALRRYDHSNIFLIIAGTYTPLAVALLPTADARTLLLGIWIAAFAGVALSTIWVSAPRWLIVPIYLLMGWASVFYLPELLANGGWAVVGLVAAGGLLYSIGAVVYALKRPNLSHTWFGFHELFHSFTVAAFACQFAAIAVAVTR